MRESMGASREREPNPNPFSNSNSKSNPNQPTRSTIFVNNLPQALDIYGFIGIFNKAGCVLDAYIPLAPEGKRRFGFVRFKNHESVPKSIQLFHNRVIRDSKVSVFEAKRDLAASQTRKSGNENFVDARYKRYQNPRNKGIASYSHLFGSSSDRVNLEVGKKRSCIKGKVSKEKLNRLLNSLVGETETPARAEVIWELLRVENLGVIKVSAFQQNKFILEFVNENAADLALTGSQTLMDLFSSLKKWAWTDYTESRFVWLEVIGVPPQGWILDNFRDIASTWGKLVGFGNCLGDSICLESLKMLVLTNRWRRIEEDVFLELEDTSFRIWVEEVEEPPLSQFFKAGDFDSEDIGQAEDEAEEEGDFREDSDFSKPSDAFDVAVEVGRAEEDGEINGELLQVETASQEVSIVDTRVDRVEDSLENGGGLRSILAGDISPLVVEESQHSEEGFNEVVPEENYESDDCDLSLASIPRVFSSTPSNLEEPESDEIDAVTSKPDGRTDDIRVPIAESSQVNEEKVKDDFTGKTFPSVDQTPFCFGAVSACQERPKSKDISSKPKKNPKFGEKRKARSPRSPRSKGSSSRRRVAKRRKRKFGRVPLAVEVESSGSAQEEAASIPRRESSTPIGAVAMAEVSIPDGPDNSEESFRAQAIRQMQFSNRLGMKIVPGEKNEEAYIQRAIRQIKERKRYIEQCHSEENSVGSSEF